MLNHVAEKCQRTFHWRFVLQIYFIIFCYSTVVYGTAAHPGMCLLSYTETSQPTNLHWLNQTISTHWLLVNTINLQSAPLRVLYCLFKLDREKKLDECACEDVDVVLYDTSDDFL